MYSGQEKWVVQAVQGHTLTLSAKFTATDPIKTFLLLTIQHSEKIFFQKINSRFIESVTQKSSDHFIIVSLDYAEKDSNNFPSLRYEYILKRIDGWQWKVTSKKQLAY